MRKFLSGLVVALAVVVGLAGASQGAVYAEDLCSKCGVENGYSDDVCIAAGCKDQTTTAPGVAINIINIVLGILAVVAVFVVVIGGIMYTTSAGSAEKMAMGKNMVLYGVIGLVVALLASAMVNFVIGAVFGGN